MALGSRGMDSPPRHWNPPPAFSDVPATGKSSENYGGQDHLTHGAEEVMMMPVLTNSTLYKYRTGFVRTIVQDSHVISFNDIISQEIKQKQEE